MNKPFFFSSTVLVPPQVGLGTGAAWRRIAGTAMGTREVYEQKLRRGNLYHDPTINPGLGTARCPRCLSLLNPDTVLSLSLQRFVCMYVCELVCMLWIDLGM